MTTPEPLNLTLNDDEIFGAELSGCIFTEDWCTEHDRDIAECFARAVAEAATAKAALFFRQGDCWCSYGGPMVGHTRQCEGAREFFEAAGIQKLE